MRKKSGGRAGRLRWSGQLPVHLPRTIGVCTRTLPDLHRSVPVRGQRIKHRWRRPVLCWVLGAEQTLTEPGHSRGPETGAVAARWLGARSQWQLQAGHGYQSGQDIVGADGRG